MKFWWVGAIAAFICPGLTTGWVYRTTVAVFDNDTCSEPASVLTYSRNNGNCVSAQSDHYNPICEGNTVTDCTWYSVGGGDVYELRQEYFGYSTPYLIVEEYLPNFAGECVASNYWWEQETYLGDAMVYRLDQVCHKNRDGSMSTKLTLDKTLTITKYNDPDCNSEASKKEVTWTMATQNRCTDNTKFYLSGASLGMVAVATFDDMDCAAKPTKITFAHHFGCTATQDAPNSVCGPNGPTQYSTLNCTNDHFEFTNSVFGDKPYLVVEKFSYTNCGVLDTVSVYVADGLCHSNVDDGTSVIVSITTEGSGTILKYSDANCRQLSETVEVTKRMVGAYSCVQDTGCGSPNGCSQRFSVGGMGGHRLEAK